MKKKEEKASISHTVVQTKAQKKKRKEKGKRKRKDEKEKKKRNHISEGLGGTAFWRGGKVVTWDLFSILSFSVCYFFFNNIILDCPWNILPTYRKEIDLPVHLERHFIQTWQHEVHGVYDHRFLFLSFFHFFFKMPPKRESNRLKGETIFRMAD
eukprot:TRINITY_DN7049_c4_g1_i1.p1 TRINITY_DN7049_c4_g1~~TRINITY_DN7049_c4_g1_i1.p1  ORF type:complete len:154 (-),score=15.75 TRINITY_DN7049_c4_g1_i1:43-504(-)